MPALGDNGPSDTGRDSLGYILRCADGSYYTGSRRGDLETRVNEHNGGRFDGHTAKRLPVTLALAIPFDSITDAITAERQIKGWSRSKKDALIRGDFDALSVLAGRRT